ncbi:hypothetical protein AKJ66_02235 [candidate division MSBL1 archaeon SCGC-AAA259E22]|uniref:Uncharacterized protein n=2 Tax=candidate division MSBL1 TaxID=215777 RepID=A0A133U5T9_9EURY|nr:hypothetical protein AKJ61_02625 [candidate division MSBL1 archaeon SCGC-AAA259B11]KXA93341.1 hypothetical protein AKJ66_02235 [candidate division MSBL1 archaeon SCGC-AAA259E22]
MYNFIGAIIISERILKKIDPFSFQHGDGLSNEPSLLTCLHGARPVAFSKFSKENSPHINVFGPLQLGIERYQNIKTYLVWFDELLR